MVSAWFWVWGSSGYHEVYLGPDVVLVLVSDALNSELGLGKLQFFISFSPPDYLMFFKNFLIKKSLLTDNLHTVHSFTVNVHFDNF